MTSLFGHILVSNNIELLVVRFHSERKPRVIGHVHRNKEKETLPFDCLYKNNKNELLPKRHMKDDTGIHV